MMVKRSAKIGVKGIKFSDEDMAKLHMESHDIHPKWNYTILPKSD